MRLNATLALVAALTLTGCAAPVVGTVVDKDWDRPRDEQYVDTERYSCGTESYPTTTYTGTGTNRKSTTTYKTRTKYCTRNVTKWRHIPDDFELMVRDDKGIVHEVDVNRTDYYRFNINDHFDNSK